MSPCPFPMTITITPRAPPKFLVIDRGIHNNHTSPFVRSEITMLWLEERDFKAVMYLLVRGQFIGMAISGSGDNTL